MPLTEASPRRCFERGARAGDDPSPTVVVTRTSAPSALKLLHVVGARPNFPKLAPVYRAGVLRGLTQVIVHTGQHYDERMSESFFRALGIPTPDVNLEVGSGSHALQTARIIERFEDVLVQHAPDWLVVYGDVNSTMATTLVASKLGVPVAHVEAGLRSGDRRMPEEINRLVTDRLSSLLLTPSRDANDTLLREGEPADRIVMVGNVMIDSLHHALAHAGATGATGKYGSAGEHVVATLHRPSNVDVEEVLRSILDALDTIAQARPVVFAVHPRTKARIEALGLSTGAIRVVDALPYFEMVDLVQNAFAVITDSGGLQEETTALGVPCFTVRDSTERPVTITEGTNQLVLDPRLLPALVRAAARPSDPRIPEGWDGKAGSRVIDALIARPTRSR